MEAACRPASPEIVGAARALVAAEGLRGLSLRRVASLAGVSLGGVAYQIGSKGELVRQLVQDAVGRQDERHRRWLARLEPMALADPAVLANVIGAYLDDAVMRGREQSLVVCELVLEAGRDPELRGGLRELIAGETSFWRAALAGVPGGEPLAGAVASYCREELPFNLAIGEDPDYRLLRAGVCARLAAGFAETSGGFAAGFEALVAAMDAKVLDVLSISADADSRRARIAGAVADVIRDDGVAAVTHRAVAAAAGAPNSTVAHYFRTREDLLRAGMEALYLRGAADLSPADTERREGGLAISRASHAMALAAARDAALVPFALDLRRRRGERIREVVARAIGGDTPADAAAAQAAAMVLMGGGIEMHALGDVAPEDPAAALQRLASLRRSEGDR